MVAHIGAFHGDPMADISLDREVPLMNARIGPVWVGGVAAAILVGRLETRGDGWHHAEGVRWGREYRRRRGRPGEHIKWTAEVEVGSGVLRVGVIEDPIASTNHRTGIVEGTVRKTNARLNVQPVGMPKPVVVRKLVGEPERLTIEHLCEG